MTERRTEERRTDDTIQITTALADDLIAISMKLRQAVSELYEQRAVMGPYPTPLPDPAPKGQQ